ncbi:ATP-dependent sacrificial sulfur transferase LarE [Candidatus Poriferisocius sp.]|uniref:ATP-dependent sacrificial sulfur transferase LarE n=1 Tax=Candidatus Poriferisocius sp. TaxID=3101276 RepID=UPI003B02754E
MGRLRGDLADKGRVVVAFSGGADSSLLAWVANDVLGDHAVAATAVSPSLADAEHRDCAVLAAEWGLRWMEVFTEEMGLAAYRANDGDRCYWCKDALMDALAPLAASRSAVVALGVNTDDLGDHRPGQRAAAERGAVFPLLDAGFAKSDIREWSQRLGLRTWDKPAAPCLASRIPYGTPVTLGALASVGDAEAALRRLGFDELRVRHYGDLARIEVPEAQLAEVVVQRAAVVEAVRQAGYRYATLDLEGLRSGNLNTALGLGPPAPSS